jgi:hypothetical protein
MSAYQGSRGRLGSYENDRYDPILDGRYRATNDNEDRALTVLRSSNEAGFPTRSRSADGSDQRLAQRPIRQSDQKYLVRRSRKSYDQQPRPVVVTHHHRPSSRRSSRSRSSSRGSSSSSSSSSGQSRSRSRSRSRSPHHPHRPHHPHWPPHHHHHHHHHGHYNVRQVAKTTITEYKVDRHSHRPSPKPARYDYTRVRVIDVRPETLDHYRYPWKWDYVRPDLIIMKLTFHD